MGETEEKRRQGLIEVITGPMFSGKTTELISRITHARISGLAVQVFKPWIDSRSTAVRSHDGLSIDATSIGEAREILELLEPETTVIALDEGQFFDHGIVYVSNLLARQEKRVIVAGLDMDFRGEPFGPMPCLLATAEIVDKRFALCTVCEQPAAFTQRLVNGAPAGSSDPLVVVGSGELYEPRCRQHHFLPSGSGMSLSPLPERVVTNSTALC